MIKPPVILIMYLNLQFSFQIHSKARMYVNELILTLFNQFDIKYKKLNLKQKKPQGMYF